MAINEIKPLTSTECVAEHGLRTLYVYGNVDCSKVYPGTMIFIGGTTAMLPVEAIRGTSPLNGVATIFLRDPWPHATTTGQMVAFNTNEGMGDAIRRIREIFSNADDVLSDYGSVLEAYNVLHEQVESIDSQVQTISQLTAAQQHIVDENLRISVEQAQRAEVKSQEAATSAAQAISNASTATTKAQEALQSRQQAQDAAQNAAQAVTAVHAESQNTLNQLNDLVVHVEQVAQAAQRTVVRFDATTEPAGGMVPMAKPDGQLAELWLNNEAAFSSFLIAFSNLLGESLQSSTALTQLKMSIADLQQSLGLVDRKIEHAVAAVRVDSTMQPGRAKVPVSKHDGQLDENWLNCESAYSQFLVAFAHLTGQSLNSLLSIDQLRASLSVIETQLTRHVTQLDKKIQVVDAAAKANLKREWFQGHHAAGKQHTLPVFNMTERDFLAEAAQEEGYAEFLRTQGASGIVNSRQYTADRGFEVGYRVHDTSYAALNIHNHANYMNQPGSAEMSAVINGYYFRTRHMDYKTMYPVQGAYLERAATNAPAIPTAVLALPTGVNNDGSINFEGTQAQYMRDVKTENPQDCQWQLAYLECWIEAQDDDSLSDPADSFRHGNESKKLTETFDKGRFLNYSGHKNRLENLSQQPMTVRYVDATGVPRFGTVQYRINTYPVADLRALGGEASPPSFVVGNSDSHYHTLTQALTSEQINVIKAGTPLELQTSLDAGHRHSVRVSWDGAQFVALDLHPGHQHPVIVMSDSSSRLPYDETKAIAGVIDNTNRFKLVRDLRSRAHNNSWTALARSRMARFECVDLMNLCEKLPGLQGEGAYLEESYNQYGLNDSLSTFTGSARLNAARYNKRYRLFQNDASGRVSAHRGFNDPTLFVAKTTHPRVVGGFSWMIPLELILRTPRENWNPFNLPAAQRPQLVAEMAASGGLSAARAYSGIHPEEFYYGIPSGLVPQASTQTDPADTGSRAWVKDATGTARLVYGSGIRVHDIDSMRQRFPVYTLYAEHSFEHTQMHWLRSNIKQLLTKATNGQLTIQEIDNLL